MVIPGDAVTSEREIRVVLDTDAFNEIDDQFAIAYALKSAPRLKVEAIHAAPFVNEKSKGPEDGMLKSLDEIERIVEAVQPHDPPAVRAGSTGFLVDQDVQPSAAVEDLVARAHTASAEDPLHVVAIGAPTNVALALLLDPTIASLIRISWLGGHALHWHRNDEFNLRQDVRASRILLDCDAPLVLLPCMGVISHLTTTLAELEKWLDPGLSINRLLLERFRASRADHFAYAHAVWDVAAVAAVKSPALVPRQSVNALSIEADLAWGVGRPGRHIEIAQQVRRNDTIGDMIRSLNS